MTEQLDIASALDLTMSDEQESKFMALKALHAKKIKQLMVSIESKEKEVAKLKVLSKDSRRTQMIQALRGKIKDMEVIQDTIKEEFAKKANMPLEEINDFIIRKTIGGPKRFRPLSREEMENKIIDYERKLNRITSKGGVDGGKSVSSQAKSINVAKDALTSIANRNEKGGKTNTATTPVSGNAAASGGDGLAKIAQLMEEINGLRNALDVAQGAVELQKEEVTRLRQRNADLAADEEEVKFLNAQYKEAMLGRSQAEEEQAVLVQRLAEAEEDIVLLRSGNVQELEHGALQLDALQTHCEKLLKQNSALLHRLADMETELDAAYEQSKGAASNTKAAASATEASQAALRDYEKKVTRLNEKLRMSEQLITELQNDNAQITQLRDQLRGKNITIKELTKQVETLSAAAKEGRSSTQRTTSAATGDNADARVKELKDENARLKQALQVALARSGGSVGGSPNLQGGSLNVSLESTDMMRMKLQSANEEAESLRLQVDKLSQALKDKSVTPTRRAGDSPRSATKNNSPKKDSPRR